MSRDCSAAPFRGVVPSLRWLLAACLLTLCLSLPLAGQGVNLGLKDVRQLADTLKEARRRERDIGSLVVLRRYERARKGDNLAMMAAMDGFKHLFGSTRAPLRWAR